MVVICNNFNILHTTPFPQFPQKMNQSYSGYGYYPNPTHYHHQPTFSYPQPSLTGNGNFYNGCLSGPVYTSQTIHGDYVTVNNLTGGITRHVLPYNR